MSAKAHVLDLNVVAHRRRLLKSARCSTCKSRPTQTACARFTISSRISSALCFRSSRCTLRYVVCVCLGFDFLYKKNYFMITMINFEHRSNRLVNLFAFCRRQQRIIITTHVNKNNNNKKNNNNYNDLQQRKMIARH